MCSRVEKQDDVDPIERIEGLVSRFETDFTAAFLVLMGTIKSELVLNEIADLIEQGLLTQALEKVEQSIAKFSDVVVTAIAASGASTAEFLQSALKVVVSFDQTNDHAVSAMRDTKLRIMQGLSTTQMQTIRETLIEGITNGDNPLQQARRFRDAIGLTPNQNKAVASYRRALESNSAAALNRALRDARFDRTVENALSSGDPLSAKQIDKMVNRYIERSVRHRAEVIARTEALAAAHKGNNLMYDQAIATGILERERLLRTWNRAKDDRVRDTHDGMQGQQQGFGVAFISDAGVLLMYPGDETAPGKETIQCRCLVTTRLLPIGQVAGVTIL